MIRICTSQFTNFYGGEIRFPYSIAILLSYAKTSKIIEENFKFEKTFLLRDKIKEYIQIASDCDILLCSHYIWNSEINLYLAKEVKKINPNCLIVFGGPNVPNDAKEFLKNNNFIDIVIHGEGEKPLKELLHFYKEKISWSSKPIVSFLKDFIKIKGVETREGNNGISESIIDLNEIPSPYLTNVALEIMEKVDAKYVATWETFRGCPFSCSFCSWGQLNAKLRKFDLKRLYDEFEWFVNNNVAYIEGADSNFGIFNDRDLELVEKIKEIKEKNNLTIIFRPSWTKTTNEKTLQMAKALHSCGVFKATTLAVQSLNEEVLKNIKRKNMSKQKYSELSSLFYENNIPTYVELIVGLPGETLQSFKEGLDYVISDTKVGTVYVYNCTLIENSEMNGEEYKKKYKIKSINSPIYLTHSQVNKKEIQEYEDIVIGSYSYSLQDIEDMFFFAWQIQVFYCFGICDKIMEYLKREKNISYIQFLDRLKEYQKDTFLTNEFNFVKDYIRSGYSGKGWDCYDLRFGDILWSIEELSWLRMINNVTFLFDNIENFIYNNYENSEIMKDLIKFQKFLLTKKEDISQKEKQQEFKYNWKEYFEGKELKKEKKKYITNCKIDSNIEWFYQAIFWGRSKRNYKSLIKEIND
jgi:radical SAM superfamily enzyme YgiQ (UPF0313 family)